MKRFSKFLLGAALLTSGSVMAQGKSGMHGNNGNHKMETVRTHSTTGVINANEHASENGQMHASDRSILNRPATVVRTRTYGHPSYYKHGKRHHHNHGAKMHEMKDE